MSKTKKPKTRVAIILDRSGSMSSIRDQAVQNYNEQIQQMQENSKDQDIFCSLVTFNGNVFEHVWNESVNKIDEASPESFVPNGSTAMRDAVGYTVQKLLDTPGDDEDTAYLVIIISDGEENSSKRYAAPQLRSLIQECQATGRWTFSYMGCSAEYLEEVARETSIPLSNMAAWSNKSVKSAEYGMRASNVRARMYYQARATGLTASDCLYNDEKGVSADFTMHEDDVADFISASAGPVVGGLTPSPLTVDVSNSTRKASQSSVARNSSGRKGARATSNDVFSKGNAVSWKS